MTEILGLLSILIPILGTPGPNNSIFMVSGLKLGYKKSIPILIATNIGVTLMLLTTISITDEVTDIIPVIDDYLSLFGILMLFYIAYKMWPKGHHSNVKIDIISYKEMFLFQFINPKIWFACIAIASGLKLSLNLIYISMVCFGIGLLINSAWVVSGYLLFSKSNIKNKILIEKFGSILIVLSAGSFFFIQTSIHI